jgi:hypothetical protein
MLHAKSRNVVPRTHQEVSLIRIAQAAPQLRLAPVARGQGKERLEGWHGEQRGELAHQVTLGQALGSEAEALVAAIRLADEFAGRCVVRCSYGSSCMPSPRAATRRKRSVLLLTVGVRQSRECPW